MSAPGALRGLWLRWKTLRLPWRKKWLCGQDLNGNTFWEFRNQLGPNRPRRIARYPVGTHHGDVKLTPAWIQWLRHTRAEAPTVEEQHLEVQRQNQMQQLAALADARWAEQPSFLDKPEETAQSQPLTMPKDRGGHGPGQTEKDIREGVRSAVGTQDEVAQSVSEGAESSGSGRFKGATKENEDSSKTRKENPWERHRGVPGEVWQPESWSPGKIQPRR